MVPSTARLDPAEARILISDELAPQALAVFRQRGYEPEVRTGMDEDELVEAVRGVHALIVRSQTKVTRRVLEAADELRVVGRAGVGVDNVDVDAATEQGIVIMNTPTGNTTTTAELAIALLCALARHVPRGDRKVRAGSWSRKGLVGTEITGKTLGVIGLGRIGRVVAERALGLKMHVVGHDPYLASTGAGSPIAGVELMELDELLPLCDFVTLHVPAMDSTRNLISRERIAQMKPGARLINAARGGLVDEIAVRDALDEGRLAGAALDVLASEPPSDEHPLVGREDVIVTPHLGASSQEAQENVALDIANQIADFLTDGVAHNAVNAPAVSARDLQEIAPYVLLAEKLGSFLAQRLDEPVRKIELTVSGEIIRSDHRHVPLAVLVGVLRHGQDTAVNFVNAPRIAKERGIRMLECADEEAGFFSSMIKVRASSRGGESSHLVAGAVFGRTPRLVRVDDLHLDLRPTGRLLITRHADVPGVVGMLGTVLGKHGINIRRIELGPPPRRDRSDARDAHDNTLPLGDEDLATGFLSLDDDPSAEVVAEIEALAPVHEVKLIRL